MVSEDQERCVKPLQNVTGQGKLGTLLDPTGFISGEVTVRIDT
jgi:hypothetical protein